jgi:hypothetical protein
MNDVALGRHKNSYIRTVLLFIAAILGHYCLLKIFDEEP